MLGIGERMCVDSRASGIFTNDSNRGAIMLDAVSVDVVQLYTVYDLLLKMYFVYIFARLCFKKVSPSRR